MNIPTNATTLIYKIGLHSIPNPIVAILDTITITTTD